MAWELCDDWYLQDQYSMKIISNSSSILGPFIKDLRSYERIGFRRKEDSLWQRVISFNIFSFTTSCVCIIKVTFGNDKLDKSLGMQRERIIVKPSPKRLATIRALEALAIIPYDDDNEDAECLDGRLFW